jgi:hypothetical protein
MGQVTAIGQRVRDAALSWPPAARAVALVTIEHDRAVSNALAEQLLRRWELRGLTDLQRHRFPAGLPHDLIDPHAIGARPDLVYPVLLDLITPSRR